MGLQELKLQLRKWAKGMLLDERRKALGLKVGPRRPPHMAVLGNRGTGNLLSRLSVIVIIHLVLISTQIDSSNSVKTYTFCFNGQICEQCFNF